MVQGRRHVQDRTRLYDRTNARLDKRIAWGIGGKQCLFILLQIVGSQHVTRGRTRYILRIYNLLGAVDDADIVTTHLSVGNISFGELSGQSRDDICLAGRHCVVIEGWQRLTTPRNGCRVRHGF